MICGFLPWRNRNRVLRSGERGAEILEFALIFAALMTLMMGIVVFARAYNDYQTITRAAREGVREGVLPTAAYLGNNLTYLVGDGACPGKATNSPGTQLFNNFVAPALEASSFDPRGVKNYRECLAWLDPAGTAANQCGVTVSFEYPYRLNIPFLGASLGTIPISTSVQMRIENQPMGAGATCGGVAAP